ncbi:MAG: DUF1761 domain-containing protein [Bacteroidia bacterium]
MEVKFWVVLVAAIIPMLTGFVWYNPKIFGKAWQVEAGMTEEKMQGANMAKIFGLAYLLSILAASSMMFLTIHQFGVFSTLATDPKAVQDPTTEVGALFKAIMEKYGTNFRTFKHGAFHGVLGALFIALPILGTNALFERKSFKYVAINVGYWILTMALMGGVVCAFA